MDVTQQIFTEHSLHSSPRCRLEDADVLGEPLIGQSGGERNLTKDYSVEGTTQKHKLAQRMQILRLLGSMKRLCNTDCTSEGLRDVNSLEF